MNLSTESASPAIWQRNTKTPESTSKRPDDTIPLEPAACENFLSAGRLFHSHEPGQRGFSRQIPHSPRRAQSAFCRLQAANTSAPGLGAGYRQSADLLCLLQTFTPYAKIFVLKGTGTGLTGCRGGMNSAEYHKHRNNSFAGACAGRLFAADHT